MPPSPCETGNRSLTAPLNPQGSRESGSDRRQTSPSAAQAVLLPAQMSATSVAARSRPHRLAWSVTSWMLRLGWIQDCRRPLPRLQPSTCHWASRHALGPRVTQTRGTCSCVQACELEGAGLENGLRGPPARRLLGFGAHCSGNET